MKNDTKKNNPNYYSDINERTEKLWEFFKVATIDPCMEVLRGFNKNTVPVVRCTLFGCLVSYLILKGYDQLLFAKIGLGHVNLPWYLKFAWGAGWTLSGYYFWGLYRMFQRRKMLKKLEDTFKNSGIQNKIGHYPKFVSDLPVDELKRRLRLTSVGLPLGKFRLEKEHIESNLNIEISNIMNPNGNKSLVDIVYGSSATPQFWCVENLADYKNFSFPIGKNQNGEVRTNLIETPHLLVAGVSGGGKSSFIRMMVAVLGFNNQDLNISFLDLKGGMESQVFEGFEGIKTYRSVEMCYQHLVDVVEKLNERKDKMAAAKCKDIDTFNKKQKNEQDKISRHLLIVDEAAELALKIGDGDTMSLKKINHNLGRIARLGRACGIHLLMGTQKPDNRNLDSIVKANLSGVLCFHVINHTQSNVVLGNRRAADLDGKIKGRAIWQQGSHQEEVQVPYLSEPEVQEAKDYFYEQRESERSHDEKENQDYYKRSNPYRNGLQNSNVSLEMEGRDEPNA